jgi:hypothetical protein
VLQAYSRRQPTYRLDPCHERVFAFRESKGYRVEFVHDESGGGRSAKRGTAGP